MSERPIYLNLLWHMHQPFYKNPLTSMYELPWVRLHGIKDYYDMVSILNEFPEVHQTFNLVPSLIEQIVDYAEGRGQDRFLILSLKDPAELLPEERIEIAKYFFMANYDNMILPFRRYRELLEKRGHHPSDESLQWVNFTHQEMFDLQVWFNLAWFDPLFRETDTIVARLIKKDRGFTEKDKIDLLDFQRKVMGMILPEYKKMSEKGIVELTTTPYYHPIMPLVYDTNIARVGMPDVNLPKRRFAYPEDVRWHIEKAINLHEKVFGVKPKGMWPSEGSVCEQILPIIKEHGISWIATDEEVLRESLNLGGDRDSRDPGGLYKAYTLEPAGNDISIVFRDHVLSDLIGFVYSKWDPVDAANNFIARLHGIRDHLKEFNGNFLVSVILDGENAWEYYKNDARDFLKALYRRLEDDRFVQSVTVSEFLELDKKPPSLKRLFPGSWINHNYGIWIGHEEDNKAWDLLHDTRDALVEFEKENPKNENLKEAWNEIYIAEGSDWNWWYGDDHSSGIDDLFDRLYRTHLSNVYRLIGIPVPAALLKSVITASRKKIAPKVEPAYSITPTIDGKNSNYFEWISAGIYEFGGAGDAMHQVTKIISKLYYGFDTKNIYFRIDADKSLIPEVESTDVYQIGIDFVSPVKMKLRFFIKSDGSITPYRLLEAGNKKRISIDAAVEDIVEIAIPRKKILSKNSQDGGLVEAFLLYFENGVEVERVPKVEPLSIEVTGTTADAERWFV